MPPRKKTKRPETFRSHHGAMFGLQVTERDPHTGAVLTVSYKFCLQFGRSPPETASNRKPISGTKSFRKPFRVDHYKQHLNSQHPTQWKEYAELETASDQTSYFSVPVPFVNTMPAHFECTSGKKIVFSFSRSIIDDLIGTLLFHPDEEEEWGRTKALFRECHESDKYLAIVANSSAFRFAVRHIAIGLSFRQTTRVLSLTRQMASLGFLQGISDKKVAGYARITTAFNLQKMSDLLNDPRGWSFSIAFDGATCSGTSIIDVRMRICMDGNLENLHVLAIPLHEKHTGESMFNVVALLFDVLCPKWKQKVLSASTGGARNMTGRLSGAVTRIEQVAGPGFVRIWCGAHQLDLVIQDCIKNIYNDDFYGVLTGLIGYLRRQQNLVMIMRTTCPKVCSTRCSLGKVSKWLVQHRVQIIYYLVSKNANVKPPLDWWLHLAVVHEFMNRVDTCFTAVQGMKTLVQQQRVYFSKLVNNLVEFSCMDGPLSEGEIPDETSSLYSTGSFSISSTAVQNLIEDLGLWAIDFEQELEEGEKNKIHGDVARLFVSAANKVYSLRAERDSQYNASDVQLPPVTSMELMVLAPREFNIVVRNQRNRLLSFGDASIMESIQEDFRNFKCMVVGSPDLRQIIAASSDTISFEDSWKLMEGRFRTLEWFCGTARPWSCHRFSWHRNSGRGFLSY